MALFGAVGAPEVSVTKASCPRCACPELEAARHRMLVGAQCSTSSRAVALPVAPCARSTQRPGATSLRSSSASSLRARCPSGNGASRPVASRRAKRTLAEGMEALRVEHVQRPAPAAHGQGKLVPGVEGARIGMLEERGGQRSGGAGSQGDRHEAGAGAHALQGRHPERMEMLPKKQPRARPWALGKPKPRALAGLPREARGAQYSSSLKKKSSLLG